MSKLHIKKGDTVIVLTGKDKGNKGKVLQVLVDENRAIVEGINLVSKSTKPSAKNPQDTFFEDLYADYHIQRVHASRAINANPSKRGKLTELLIRNYE